MSILDAIERKKYTLQIVKKIPQRPEHLASVMSWSPKAYKYRFITIHKFDEIPEHFIEVLKVILFKGRQVDGTPYGLYELVLHGRGKKYGQTDSTKVKYLGGATVSYNGKELKIERVQVKIRVFLKFLATIREVNRLFLNRGK